MSYIIIGVVAGILFLFVLIVSLLARYKRCPSDHILVVYGKVGSDAEGGRSAKCIHGGAAFIWPIFQDYAFLDLTPLSIEVNLTSALSRQNIRVDVPSRFTVGISTEPATMVNAAERLLGLSKQDIHNLAIDIIFGQLRLVVATMDIEEINNNRDKFLSNVASNVEAELQKIGLKLINVNVTDIKDESGYIEALGKEAAAKAVNDARKTVAEKNRDGSIGESIAQKDERVQVAAAIAEAKIGEAAANQNERVQVASADSKAKVGEAEANANARIGEAEAQKQERMSVAEANARAVEGENTSRIAIADSDSERRQREAEAVKKAVAMEKVSQARALEEAYAAEEKAERARAEKERATQTANQVVSAEVDKTKIEIDAEAEAERIRRIAKGEADAILFRKQAEAQGLYEVLSKQAQGFQQLVSAAGNNSKDAAMLMIADKLEQLVRLQAEAIQNVKIDKVTVWDSGSKGKDGKTNTADFISGMYGSVPPLQEMFQMAGLNLPEYLKGKESADEEVQDAVVEEKPTPKSAPKDDSDKNEKEEK